MKAKTECLETLDGHEYQSPQCPYVSREVMRAYEAGGGSSSASIAVLMAIVYVGVEHLLRAKKQSLTIQKLTLTSYY